MKKELKCSTNKPLEEENARFGLPNFGLKAINYTSSTGLNAVVNVAALSSSQNDCH